MDIKNTTPNYNIDSFKLNYRACIPLYVLLDDRLSKNEIKLYGLIEQMESSMTDVFINDRSLCKILNISFESRMLGRIQKKLKDLGYLKREEREITINNKTFYASCWSTIKQSVVFSDIDTSVPEVPTLINNITPSVPEVPTPPVLQVPTPPVPGVPTYNTHDIKSHESNVCVAKTSTHTHDSLKENLTSNSRCSELFNTKFKDREITIEILAVNIIEHYAPKTPTINQFYIWINRELIDNYPKRVAKVTSSGLSYEERQRLQEEASEKKRKETVEAFNARGTR